MVGVVTVGTSFVPDTLTGLDLVGSGTLWVSMCEHVRVNVYVYGDACVCVQESAQARGSHPELFLSGDPPEDPILYLFPDTSLRPWTLLPPPSTPNGEPGPWIQFLNSTTLEFGSELTGTRSIYWRWGGK